MILTTNFLDSLEHARQTWGVLNSACWESFTHRPTGTDAQVEAVRVTRSALNMIRKEAIAKFGKVNPKHPECDYCIEVSVFGGPGHDASPYCRSGRRAHCTCDTCY